MDSSRISKPERQETRECTRCGRVLPKRAFFDPKLATQYARLCPSCKGEARAKRVEANTLCDDIGPRRCPICGAAMVRRHGSCGPFWGCAAYPYCRGTRNI